MNDVNITNDILLYKKNYAWTLYHVSNSTTMKQLWFQGFFSVNPQMVKLALS